MNKLSVRNAVLCMVLGVTAIAASPLLAAGGPTLSAADFEKAKTLYFQRCAGCHGVLRKGATGKNLEPKSTRKKGQRRLEKIIAFGTEGGMNNFDDIFSRDEIKLLATYIQMEPPVPPEMPLEMMQKRTRVFVDPKSYPTKPLHDRNWENFFIVIERDAGKVAIIDGDSHEIITHINTGYAVHVAKSAEKHATESVAYPGRFWYTIGRDGRVKKIDLWQIPERMLVAETQIAYDARDISVSGDGKYLIAGGYWPPHFVIIDAETMNPIKVVSTRGANVDGFFIDESRVATVDTTPNLSAFLVSAKELGQVWQVDYTDLDNLRVDKINAARYLHDGFFDPTGRYFQVAANASNKMAIIDTETRKLAALIDMAQKPHTGPGANWVDPDCGPVGATAHLGEAKVTTWGNDPAGHPKRAWKVCRVIKVDGAGSFIRSHPKSDFVWVDQLMHPEQVVKQSVQVISKKTGRIVKTIRVTKHPGFAAVHIEFNKDGTEVWVSAWNRKDYSNDTGYVVIYDAKTLREKARIKGLRTPTGKFNVYNRINHVS